jgi:hypothetical protein
MIAISGQGRPFFAAIRAQTAILACGRVEGCVPIDRGASGRDDQGERRVPGLTVATIMAIAALPASGRDDQDLRVTRRPQS